ncbi:phosphodiester glycosidase family protein [Longilinea arvoryzae]|nr:phosphodiester glycosidase family protein [Longilinea arvoryzae]
MIKKIALLLVWIGVAFSPALSWSPAQAAASGQTEDGWEVLTPGVDYREFTLPGPVRAYVVRMAIKDDPDDPVDITLESAIGRGYLGGLETVRGMAARYDDAIDYWGSEWGNRSDILVAVNGSYFGGSDTPENGMVQSGWYAKRFDNLNGGSGLVWTLTRQVFIDDCVTHRPEKQILHIDGDATAGFSITGINTSRSDNDLIVYTPQFGARTPDQTNGVEVVVKMTRPLLILPYSTGNSTSAVIGKVTEIREAAGSTLIHFDELVLSAGENQREALLSHLNIGSTVLFNQEITSLSRDCGTPVDLPWTKAYTSLGAAFHLLEDGKIYTPAQDTTRAPRTALAYDPNYIYLIVVDGRQPDISVGMTFQELAGFIRDTLGAQDGVAQDGGGSSTMVVNGQVVNRPSDICYTVFLPLVSSSGTNSIPNPTQTIPLEEKFEPNTRLQAGCERRVANAILIARVLPREYSKTSFTGSDLVFTTTATALRTGPGTNYPGFAAIPAGNYGILLDDPEFDGIRAKGTYWWKISILGKIGWIDEKAIATLAPRFSFWPFQH